MKKYAILRYQSLSRSPVNALALSTEGEYLAVAQGYRKADSPSLTVFSRKVPYKPLVLVTSNQKANSVSAIHFSKNRHLIYLTNSPDDAWQLTANSVVSSTQPVSVALPASPKPPRLFIEDQMIWVVLPNEVRVYDTATLQLENTYPLASGVDLTVTDGRIIWWADGHILWAADINQSKHTPLAFDLILSQLQISANFIWGVGEFGRGLFGWQKTGQPLSANTVLNNPETTVTAFAVSPDEEWVAFGNASGYVILAGRETGKQRWGSRLHKGHVSAITFSSDGKWMATGGSVGDTALLKT